MKNALKIVAAIALTGSSLMSSAQQISLNSLYNQNQYLLNPAAVGAESCFSAFLNHRNQWAGINNSPVRNMITVDGQVGSNHGIGGKVEVFSAGLLRTLDAKLTYAYHLKLTETSTLSAGISAGIVQQNFGFADAIATDYSDNLLLGGNQSDLGFSTDVGLLFRSPRANIGFAVPHVYSNGLNIVGQGETREFKLVNHMILHGSYDIVQGSKWDLSANALYRNANLIGHQVDLGAIARWRKTLGVGAMYRTSYGVIGMIDLKIKEKFFVAYGYGFGFGSRNYTALSGGSHEVMIGLTLCKDRHKPIIEEPIVEEIVEIEEVEEVVEEIVEIDPIEEIEEVEEEVVDVPLDIESLNKSFELTDRRITYELNSSEEINSKNEEKVLNEVVEIMQEHPEVNATIYGNSCDLGTSEYNMQISKKRAEDIKAELVKRGISVDRLKVVANGESKPIVPNTSEENRQKNRRVDIQFVLGME